MSPLDIVLWLVTCVWSGCEQQAAWRFEALVVDELLIDDPAGLAPHTKWALERAVRRGLGRIATCVTKPEHTPGGFYLDIAVDPNGRVGAAAVHTSITSPNEPAFEPCVLAVVRDLKLPPVPVSVTMGLMIYMRFSRGSRAT